MNKPNTATKTAKLTFFRRCMNSDGEPSSFMWNLISWHGKKPWALSWHKRNHKCRLGWYRNRTTNIGLKACLNLPLIGDFSLWRYWSGGK